MGMQMKKEKKRKLLPAMLAIALAAALVAPTGSGAALAADDGFTLTVNVGNEFITEDQMLNNVGLRIYKLADLTEGNGTYSWDLTSDFKKYDDSEGSLEKLLDEASKPGLYTPEQKKALNDLYQNLAGEATALITNKDITSSYESKFGQNQEIAEKGLYIIVPALDGVIETDEDTGNVTVTTSEWIYTFNPLIVSVPTKKAHEDGTIGTADEYGNWISPDISLDIDKEVQVNAKIVRKPALGSIQIVKELNQREGKAESATFVFFVKATKKGEAVYENVVSISLPNQDRVTIDNLPVGSKVEIKEIYTSPSYQYISGIPEDGLVVDDKADDQTVTQVVTVTNNYNDNHYHGGGGIENQYANTDNEKSSGKSWKFIGRIINGVVSMDSNTNQAEE